MDYIVHVFYLFSCSCSVPCYKVHKEVCSSKNKSQEGDEDKSAASPPKRKRSKKDLPSLIFVDDEEEKVVPEEKLQRLEKSEELKRVLRNPHLRNFLSHLNSTHNPSGFMQYAMQEPIFVEFADACLKAIHPELQGEEESDETCMEKVQVRCLKIGLVWFIEGLSCQGSKFLHEQLDRKGFFSILLLSPCMTGSPQFWLDTSLLLGAPLSWEMSLTQNTVAFLTRSLFLASLSHQRSLVTGKLDLKRARHLSNF